MPLLHSAAKVGQWDEEKRELPSVLWAEEVGVETADPLPVADCHTQPDAWSEFRTLPEHP